jgi:hypothetical protein
VLHPVAFEKVKHRVVSMHASDRYLAPGATLTTCASDGAAGYSRLLHGETGRGLNDFDAIFASWSASASTADLDRGRRQRPRRNGPLGRLPEAEARRILRRSPARRARPAAPAGPVTLTPIRGRHQAFAAIALLFVAIAGSMLINQRWAHPLPPLDALPDSPRRTRASR